MFFQKKLKLKLTLIWLGQSGKRYLHILSLVFVLHTPKKKSLVFQIVQALEATLSASLMKLPRNFFFYKNACIQCPKTGPAIKLVKANV